MVRCAKCSGEKKHCDIGMKLSRAYLHEGQYNEAVSLCEQLMQLSCDTDDNVQLSLSRVIASAAAASPRICTDHRQPLVSFYRAIQLC